ncbi:hypothetical protein RvY_06988 [Ramazzottius varieornatus]|uniref:Uncharacterized protein n=1 Tax=Ramazzottius varieornatus TaxID=947166 RepID=A0A1D1VA14_RAMVA|nr:hypothetical protein RvY_06988 [Ramazzottius varieornatus]
MGDFNVPDIHWPNLTAQSSHGRALIDACREFSLKQIVDVPTRNENAIDLVFLSVSVPYSSMESICGPTDTCDHHGVQLRATIIRKNNPRLVRRLRRKFDDTNNEALRAELSNTDWNFLFAAKVPSEQAEAFEDAMLPAARKFHRVVSVRQRFGQVEYPPFVTRALSRRDVAFRKLEACLDYTEQNKLKARWKLFSRNADMKAKRYQQHLVMQAATSTRNPKSFGDWAKRPSMFRVFLPYGMTRKRARIRLQ